MGGGVAVGTDPYADAAEELGTLADMATAAAGIAAVTGAIPAAAFLGGVAIGLYGAQFYAERQSHAGKR